MNSAIINLVQHCAKVMKCCNSTTSVVYRQDKDLQRSFHWKKKVMSWPLYTLKQVAVSWWR